MCWLLDRNGRFELWRKPSRILCNVPEVFYCICAYEPSYGGSFGDHHLLLNASMPYFRCLRLMWTRREMSRNGHTWHHCIRCHNILQNETLAREVSGTAHFKDELDIAREELQAANRQVASLEQWKKRRAEEIVALRVRCAKLEEDNAACLQVLDELKQVGCSASHYLSLRYTYWKPPQENQGFFPPRLKLT